MITIRDKKMQAIVNKNKGFTLTEMIIVIAVIAILAAVLIPTFIGISNKAKLSADVQSAKNATTLAANETDIQKIYNAVSKEEVNKIDLFKTEYAKCFAYEVNSKSFVLLNDKYEIIENDTVKNQTKIDIWLFAKDNSAVSNAEKLTSYDSVSYFLVDNYSGNFAFSNLVGFSTGDSTLTGNVYYGEASAITTNATVEIAGNINGKVYINAPSADFNQKGYIKQLDIKAVKGNSFNVNGRIGEVSISQGRLAVAQNAYVSKVVVPTSAVSNAVKVETKGFIDNLKVDNTEAVEQIKYNGGSIAKIDGTVSDSKKEGESSKEIAISDLVSLESFRDQVNAGTTFEDFTVKLTSDIRLNDGWTPIGAFSRNGDHAYRVSTNNQSFSGIFDGQNHKITNLNAKGFDVRKTQALGRNSTTLANKEEFAYGLFGIVTGKNSAVVIKNLTIENVNIDIQGDDNSLEYGDSVGSVVGFASGDLTLDNVKVSGATVKAYDSIGGLIGRIYDVGAITINNCKFAGSVLGACKVGGLIGYAGKTGSVEQDSKVQIQGTEFDGQVIAEGVSGAYGSAVMGAVSFDAKADNTIKNISINVSGSTLKGGVTVTTNNTNTAYIAEIAYGFGTDVNVHVTITSSGNNIDLVLKKNGVTV